MVLLIRLLKCCVFFGFCSLLAACGQAASTPGPIVVSCDPPVEEIRFDGPDETAISTRMKDFFESDQASREPGKINPNIESEDLQRRVEVMGYLQRGLVKAAADLYYAAMIFQHGNCPEHYKLANLLAERAMRAGYRPARWLYAGSLDRYLVSTGQPQKYGTQYFQDSSGEWQLHPVDPQVSDEERRQYDVPSLDEARAQAAEL